MRWARKLHFSCLVSFHVKRLLNERLSGLFINNQTQKSVIRSFTCKYNKQLERGVYRYRRYHFIVPIAVFPDLSVMHTDNASGFNKLLSKTYSNGNAKKTCC